MNLQDLLLFTTVAQAGSFTAAAAALNMPKATVSRRVAGFERDLGVPLLHRSTRHLALSEAGEHLLTRAAPLLDDLSTLDDEVTSLQQVPRGRLRLQVPLEFPAEELAGVLAGFAIDHPDVKLRCTQQVGAEPVNPEDFDLTLLCYELGLPSSDWIARPLMSLRQGLFAAPELARRYGSADLLEGAPCVTAPGESVWHLRAARDRAIAVTVSPVLQLDSPVMRVRAAERGVGIAKAPLALVEPALAAGTLAPLPMPELPVALSVAMLYRSRALPAKVRVLLDYLQSNLARRG